jgi:hypothetical protein
MSTSTSTADTGTSSRSSAVRSAHGEHVVVVRFAAWGPQDSSIRASSGGGRGGAPYIAVQVGACLTYAYDRAAVRSHLEAWQQAEKVNRSVRLPEFLPATASRRHAGEDLTVLCNISAAQHFAVTSNIGPDRRPVITVIVGAVTVDAHTTTALRSHLAAWRRAWTVTELLQDADADL